MIGVPRHSESGMNGSQFRDDSSPAAHPVDFDRLIPAARRQIGVVIVACIISAFGAAGWILASVPRYTADAFILIDNKRVRAVEDAYDINTPSSDGASSVIDSQVEVVRSENVALSVIRKLDLLSDPKFDANLPAGPDLVSRVRHTISQFLGWEDAAATKSEDSGNARDQEYQALLHQAANALRLNVDVHRVPRAMVLQISYTSQDPATAARIANAYAEAYLADQLDGKFEATKRASSWLEGRIEELKKKALAADLAIQKFKEEHGLVSSGGKLVNEQQLNEINSQLVLARSEVARAEALYKRIDSIVKNHQTDAVVSEAIGNGIIAQLRGKYLDASKRESEISQRLGPHHQQAANLREEMRQYERLMFEELGRLAESYRSEVEIARNKEKTLTASLATSVSVNANENKILVPLHELEREGEAYRNLYRTYLERYQAALQQQSFPIIEARIITSASAPSKPSYPKKAVILLVFLFIGGSAGVAIGVWREFKERGFQSEEQVRSDLGLECLGILPLLSSRFTDQEDNDYRASQRILDGKSPTASHIVRPKLGLMSYVLDNPGSGFAETLLAVKLAADMKLAGHSSKLIGIVSSLPSEGKSVFSKNLGSLLAKTGCSTLLIDADLRAPNLTRSTAPAARAGLVEAVINGQPLEEILWYEERSGLSILPTVVHARPSHTSEFLASVGMKELLAQVTSQYDYVLVDLPPLGPVVDARAMAPEIGAFVLVVEWRRAARKMVRNILSNEIELYRKCLGVVLNKVNISEMKLYETYSSRYFHYKDYVQSYYVEAPPSRKSRWRSSSAEEDDDMAAPDRASNEAREKRLSA